MSFLCLNLSRCTVNAFILGSFSSSSAAIIERRSAVKTPRDLLEIIDKKEEE